MFSEFKLSLENGVFILDCPTTYSAWPRRAGFAFDKKQRVWKTPFRHVVQTLFRNPSPEVKHLLDLAYTRDRETFEASKSHSSSLVVPAPIGKTYYPYQVAGVEYCLEKPAVLVADEMGLGKTVIGAGYMNYARPRKVLIVCPKTLKSNWRKELDAWLVYQPHVEILNYDVLHKHKTHIDSVHWDLLILDEAHYVKNKKANRTVLIFGSPKVDAIKYKKLLLLTGTPIDNRPIELFELLKVCVPWGFPNKHTFALDYCEARLGKFGWDYKGANRKKLGDLQVYLRSKCMLRRLKKDVLKDLPPKFRQVIEIDPDTKAKKYLGLEQDVLSNIKGLLGLNKEAVLDEDAWREVVKLMQDGSTYGAHIATLRRETAVAKAPLCFDHIAQAIEAHGKVVVFAWHTEVINLLFEKFKAVAVKIDGSCSDKDRDGAVARFQTDASVKLFVGQIKAAGVGITLTAASHAIFVELDWAPSNVTQAEDRLHRIGAKSTVIVQHLVLAGSIDSVLAKRIVLKQDLIDKVTDIGIDETESEKIAKLLT